jgi:hypothetical protein
VALAIDKLVSRPYTCTGVHVHRYMYGIYTGWRPERARTRRADGRAGGGRDEMRGRKSVLSSVTNQIPDIIVRYKPTHLLVPSHPSAPPVPFCNVNLARNLRAPLRVDYD